MSKASDQRQAYGAAMAAGHDAVSSGAHDAGGTRAGIVLPDLTAVVTSVRTRTPPPHGEARPSGSAVTFQELRTEALAQAEHNRIWRDHLRAEGAHRHADHRHRLVDIYTAMVTLVERANDPQIMARLRELAAQAKRDAETDEDGNEEQAHGT